MPNDRLTRMAEHRTIMAIDVERFGDHHRTNPDQAAVRTAMYQAVEAALAAAEVPWDDFHWEDRGDGVFILVPPHIPKAPFIESVPYHLANTLREHNETHQDREQIRLRMVLRDTAKSWREAVTCAVVIVMGERRVVGGG